MTTGSTAKAWAMFYASEARNAELQRRLAAQARPTLRRIVWAWLRLR